MTNAFCIWVVSPPRYLHSRCFEEAALSLHAAFKALGMDAPIVTDPAQIGGRLAITLGANLLSFYPPPRPQNLILYNLEQIQAGSPWLKADYMDLLRQYKVWDYSPRNIEHFKSDFGIDDVALCGIGYMPELTRIPASPKDIDVLFIGSMSERRHAALLNIHARGKKVVTAYNCYGAERDAQVARAKIVINIHFFEAQVFEIVRASYLMANRVCIVSETGKDETLEAPFKDGIAFAPYEGLAEKCMQLLEDEAARNAIAQRGFECFKAQSQVPMLERALKSVP